MRILVIGGTRFVGRHFVEAARAAGHTITLFHRGKTGSDVFPDVETIQGDRDQVADLDKLRGQTWDAVLDTCAYIPRHVRMLTEVIRESTPHYVFISTISVYSDPVAPDADEDTPLITLDDPTVEQVTGETYGGLKVLCESAARESGIPSVTLVRPGMIVGPHDPTDRFTYWVERVARGGEMLVPGDPRRRVQYIDGRDLAAWLVKVIENRITGTFNTVNPPHGIAWEEWMNEMRAEFGSDAWFTFVPDSWLEQRGVTGGELPFWAPAPHDGILAMSNNRAYETGLRARSTREIARDTLAWSRSRADDVLKAGLSPEREAALLSEWHSDTEPH